ncbi:MAG: hypothetical protein JO352_39030 [Chloroflexi bacterium]|nr:hypothetical protein [Chloroflexota bacterium]MBV9598472.1 hypothetical protein [Chloroflexota bacterium]
MSAFDIDKLLHSISTRPAWEEFLTQADARMDACNLTRPEREALLGGDVRTLYEMGVNEYLLLRYSGWIGLGGGRLTRALVGARREAR